MTPRLLLPAAALAALPACSTTAPDQSYTDFVVAVENETFVLRVTDPETVALARAGLRGENARFPIGALRRGDGGFNAPWSWHIDSAEARLTEAAIEVCDGRPSYVEAHVDDYVATGYCPWGGRIVGIRP